MNNSQDEMDKEAAKKSYKELMDKPFVKYLNENYPEIRSGKYDAYSYEAGFDSGITYERNRQSEVMAKMDNEEAFEKWWISFNKTCPIEFTEKERMEWCFFFATKLKDVEIMELKKENERLSKIIGDADGYYGDSK